MPWSLLACAGDMDATSVLIMASVMLMRFCSQQRYIVQLSHHNTYFYKHSQQRYIA